MNSIILDGPDGSGKSYLAELLKKRDYKLVHFGVPPAEALKSEQSMFRFYLDPMYEEISQNNLVVFDRSHLSEPIYGPVMRGGTAMTYKVEAMLERYFEAVDGQIVICLPPYRVAFNNWVQRKGAEYVKHAGNYRKIYEGYARLLFNQKRNRNFIWYDYTRHHNQSMARSLIRLRGERLPYGVVGSQRPRFLFVGERPGAGNENRDLPFLSPDNSSGFLFDCMKLAGYQENEVAFVNAYNGAGDATDLRAVIQDLDQRKLFFKVIALGAEAYDALKKIDEQPLSLNHPQYVKRFGGKGNYVEQLKDIRRRSK